MTIKKCDSPVGDGNPPSQIFVYISPDVIKKCDSPVGDGNMVLRRVYKLQLFLLRNVIPR